jgi:hypothetical protein
MHDDPLSEVSVLVTAPRYSSPGNNILGKVLAANLRVTNMMSHPSGTATRAERSGCVVKGAITPTPTSVRTSEIAHAHRRIQAT